ncbi:uncharacterized protein LOC141585842 [Silene latifolia]|uniref:uncharacterized protein LOC141585842 n=1 Tax=Silene latifolia TaxID=37657 RepID=UPI003D7828D8
MGISSNQISLVLQFSVTEHLRVLMLDNFQLCLDFLLVTFKEEHMLLHFLTNVSATIGGVFTVSGILDFFIYHGQKAIKKKMEIDKFS